MLIFLQREKKDKHHIKINHLMKKDNNGQKSIEATIDKKDLVKGEE